MSGSSYNDTCPRCGEEMSCYSDRKPHDIVSGTCLNCGYAYDTIDRLATLDDVNELREDMELEPLSELAKPTEEWLSSGYEPVKT